MLWRIVQLPWPGGYGVQSKKWYGISWRYVHDPMDPRGVKRFFDKKDAEKFIDQRVDCEQDLRVGF